MYRERQDKLWNDLSEEQRKEYLDIYKHDLNLITKGPSGHSLSKAEGRFEILVSLFGEHNFNPKPPTPKTWEDVEKYREDEDSYFCEIENALHKNYVEGKLAAKLLATYKIAKLIDLGYGGIMSEEEWKGTSGVEKFCVVWIGGTWGYMETYDNKQLISFHTPEQREKFMFYESNRKLVEQYYRM